MSADSKTEHAAEKLGWKRVRNDSDLRKLEKDIDSVVYGRDIKVVGFPDKTLYWSLGGRQHEDLERIVGTSRISRGSIQSLLPGDPPSFDAGGTTVENALQIVKLLKTHTHQIDPKSHLIVYLFDGYEVPGQSNRIYYGLLKDFNFPLAKVQAH